MWLGGGWGRDAFFGCGCGCRRRRRSYQDFIVVVRRKSMSREIYIYTKPTTETFAKKLNMVASFA